MENTNSNTAIADAAEPTVRLDEVRRLMALMTGDEKHSPAATSTLDVLWVLYTRVLRGLDPREPDHPLRDRFLLSKGHGPVAYYAVLAVFPFAAQDRATALAAVVLLGLVGFATTTPLQMMVMNRARHAPTLASASNQAAFNLANAGGAWAGGLAIASGWGWTSPAWVAAALALTGLLIAVLAGRLDRATPGTSRLVAAGGPRSRQPVR